MAKMIDKTLTSVRYKLYDPTSLRGSSLPIRFQLHLKQTSLLPKHDLTILTNKGPSVYEELFAKKRSKQNKYIDTLKMFSNTLDE